MEKRLKMLWRTRHGKRRVSSGFGEAANMKKVIADVGTHYDLLIEENNDPVRDPAVLQEYMDSWDGRLFLEMMELDPSKSVLEIGVGTGRLAVKTAPCCRHLTGIDMSAKTIERARENLREYPNITLICDDFLAHSFSETYDVIYSSLTMMHFPNKELVIGKMSSLLSDEGLLCLSIDKNQSEWIDMGNRKVRIYPDTPEKIAAVAGQAGLKTKQILEIENAYLLALAK